MPELAISRNAEQVIRSVNKHKTLLLIGESSKRFGVNEILYYDSLDKAITDYGEGSLVDAFRTAKRMKASYVFLLNMSNKEDLIDMFDVIKEYDFAYIAPVNFYMSDVFYDGNNNGRETTYAEYYRRRVSRFNDSTLVLTDKHASLYEDIDHFLDEMKTISTKNKYRYASLQRGRNLLFVTNNLKDFKMSNVVLASALASQEVSVYPSFDKFEAVFDIGPNDINDADIAYFRNDMTKRATIENLVNMEQEIPMLKSVFVDRIIKVIKRSIDFHEFHGKGYRVAHKLQIERLLTSYLEQITGSLIRQYTIDRIEFVKESIGVGRIECTFTIWPKSTVGGYTIVLGGRENE